jgi:hypothetical protein
MKFSMKKVWVVGLLFMPLVFLLQSPTGFPFPSSGAEFSDVPVSHYPNALFLKRELLETGSVPLWSPAILSGYPFASNPLSGMWYPPGWLALIFPLPMGFNLVAAFHLLWGGYGLYRYLITLGLSKRSSIFSALIFEMMPKLIAHYGAGHLTLFYAMSWTPWLLWAVEKNKSDSSHSRLVSPGILAMICLADPRWSVYAGILWVTYVVARSRFDEAVWSPNANSSKLVKVIGSLRLFSKTIIGIFPQIAITVLLTCPMLVPLLEYTRLSTRMNMSIDDILVFSLPPGRFLGLFYPDFNGNHELMVYTGSAVIVLVAIAALKRGKHSQERFWLLIALISMLFALGSHIPFMSRLAMLPGLKLLRVPSRALFLTNLAFAILTAYTVEALLSQEWVSYRQRGLLGLMAIAAFSSAMSIGVWFVTKEITLNFVFGTLFVLISSIWIGLRLVGKIPVNIWYIGLILIVLFDLGVMNRSLLSFRAKIDVLQENNEVAAYLANQEGYFRVYSPSYSLPQQVAMEHNLELADGVDPLHLEAYAGYMDEATGVPCEGYHVTIPPFENADPDHDNRTYHPDPYLLGRLNVRYIVSEFDVDVHGLELRDQFNQTRVYENMMFYPRVWIQKDGSLSGAEIQPVEITQWHPNFISVSASGPGLLVLSEIMYPGWKVIVDGETDQIVPFDGIFRSVSLGDGQHSVEFRFQPESILLGMSLFVLGIMTAILYSRWYRRCNSYREIVGNR